MLVEGVNEVAAEGVISTSLGLSFSFLLGFICGSFARVVINSILVANFLRLMSENSF